MSTFVHIYNCKNLHNMPLCGGKSCIMYILLLYIKISCTMIVHHASDILIAEVEMSLFKFGKKKTSNQRYLFYHSHYLLCSAHKNFMKLFVTTLQTSIIVKLRWLKFVPNCVHQIIFTKIICRNIGLSNVI